MDVNIYTEKCNLFLITELRINPMRCCSKLALIAPFPTKTEMWHAQKRKGVCQRGRGGGRLSLWPSVTVTVPQTHSWLMNLVTNERIVGLQLVMSCFISTTGWSLIFKFYHSGFEWTFYFPLYFIPFIKIADRWKFLRSHFRRPYQVKCKNHLKFRNIGLTVEQMSSSLLVFSLDFLLCLFWKHTSNLEIGLTCAFLIETHTSSKTTSLMPVLM